MVCVEEARHLVAKKWPQEGDDPPTYLRVEGCSLNGGPAESHP